MTGADMRTACQKPGDFTAGFIHRAIRPPFVIFYGKTTRFIHADQCTAVGPRHPGATRGPTGEGAMTVTRPLHKTPRSYLRTEAPNDPVLPGSPEWLHHIARHFLDGVPGLVTRAVKAGPAASVTGNLARTGMTALPPSAGWAEPMFALDTAVPVPKVRADGPSCRQGCGT